MSIKKGSISFNEGRDPGGIRTAEIKGVSSLHIKSQAELDASSSRSGRQTLASQARAGSETEMQIDPSEPRSRQVGIALYERGWAKTDTSLSLIALMPGSPRIIYCCPTLIP